MARDFILMVAVCSVALIVLGSTNDNAWCVSNMQEKKIIAQFSCGLSEVSNQLKDLRHYIEDETR